jgi:hypothetical protein
MDLTGPRPLFCVGLNRYRAATDDHSHESLTIASALTQSCRLLDGGRADKRG